MSAALPGSPHVASSLRPLRISPRFFLSTSVKAPGGTPRLHKGSPHHSFCPRLPQASTVRSMVSGGTSHLVRPPPCPSLPSPSPGWVPLGSGCPSPFPTLPSLLRPEVGRSRCPWTSSERIEGRRPQRSIMGYGGRGEAGGGTV